MYKPFLIIVLIILVIILFNNIRQNFISIDNKINQSIIHSKEHQIKKNQNNSEYREEILSENPKIIYIHNFLNAKEAAHFIDIGDKLKQPSTIDTKDSPISLVQDVRSSQSAHVGKRRDTIVSYVEDKAVKYMGSDINKLEPLQVVVYEKGQKYNPHYDFFTPNTPDVINRGNRTKTILVYLNDIPKESGGATYFPKINLRVQPKGLDAIYFENMNDNNELDYNTLHAGEPILTDVKKYAINIWLREKNF
jgi:prolyl 4-hydroxylase